MALAAKLAQLVGGTISGVGEAGAARGCGAGVGAPGVGGRFLPPHAERGLRGRGRWFGRPPGSRPVGAARPTGRRPARAPGREGRHGRAGDSGQRGARATRRVGCRRAAGRHGCSGARLGRRGRPTALGRPRELCLRALLDAGPGAYLRHHRVVDHRLLLRGREPRRQPRREWRRLDGSREPGPGRPHFAGARRRRAGGAHGERLRPELARRARRRRPPRPARCRLPSSRCCRPSRSTASTSTSRATAAQTRRDSPT